MDAFTKLYMLVFLWCYGLKACSIQGFLSSRPNFGRKMSGSNHPMIRQQPRLLISSTSKLRHCRDDGVVEDEDEDEDLKKSGAGCFSNAQKSTLMERRDALFLSLLGGVSCTMPSIASAKTSLDTASASTSAMKNPVLSSSSAVVSPSSPSSNSFVAPVTHKVFMNVRISRSDGTFYVRDEDENNEDDQVLYARLLIGLFGTVAPVNVQRFLSYIPGALTTSSNKSDDDEEEDLDESLLSLPSYAQSTFPSLDQATGLLSAGFIPALHVTEFNGASALQYGGRLFPAPLWLETSSSSSRSGTSSDTTTTTSPPARVSHAAAKGLLTHRQLDVTPAFQMTTRVVDSETAQELDATHVVFGQVVLWDPSDPSALSFFRRLQDLPTYSASRPTSTTSTTTTMATMEEGDTTIDAVASSLYRAQRNFFRGAAQTLGDQRLGNVYEGKFLRRVEVTQIGLL